MLAPEAHAVTTSANPTTQPAAVGFVLMVVPWPVRNIDLTLGELFDAHRSSLRHGDHTSGTSASSASSTFFRSGSRNDASTLLRARSTNSRGVSPRPDRTAW